MHFKEAKSILSPKNGMNLYRGCTHGCIYCDSRSKCYGMDHEFEDVEVKSNAPELLLHALTRKRKKCMIATGAMSDPYIPLEMELGYTRRCLEIIKDLGFGLAIQTKSDRILRDLSLLQEINENSKCVVQMTLTTFDEELCGIVEPNVQRTRDRFHALLAMRDAGIPTVVWLSPILPFINDTEENLRGVLEYCMEAKVLGILSFGMGMTLREGNREYYYEKLDEHFPGLSELYRKRYGKRYEVRSDQEGKLLQIFHSQCERYGVMHDVDQIFHYLHQYPERPVAHQLGLFSQEGSPLP